VIHASLPAVGSVVVSVNLCSFMLILQDSRGPRPVSRGEFETLILLPFPA